MFQIKHFDLAQSFHLCLITINDTLSTCQGLQKFTFQYVTPCSRQKQKPEGSQRAVFVALERPKNRKSSFRDVQPPRLLRPYERLWQESTLSTAQNQGFKGLFTSSFLALNQCCTKYYILYTCSFVLSCLFALLLLETVLPENSDIFLAELFTKIVWRIYIGRELNNLGNKI